VQTQVLIIGGGATGTGLLRDLALRGVSCVLVEQSDLNAGASGGNHGLLHSGGRYVGSDLQAARECFQEGRLLKKLAPHCIEDTGGLFVAVSGDALEYAATFPDLCAQAGIPIHSLTPKEALEREPALHPDVQAAYSVPDATIDPFQLCLENVAHAKQLGALFFRQTQVVGVDLDDKAIKRVRLWDRRDKQSWFIEAEQVVNAAGAWSGKVAALAGLGVSVRFSKGTLAVTQRRVTREVVNRLRPPSDGDIVVPGGTVSIVGTTSVRIEDLERIEPTVAEVDLVVDEAAALVPCLEQERFMRAYAGVRPLLDTGSGGSDRTASRGFALIDHRRDGLDNMTTITGGKLTTFRLMAEHTADLVCAKLGVQEPCRTAEVAYPEPGAGAWTEPAQAPRHWMARKTEGDILLCECEMVPREAVREVCKSMRRPDIQSIGLRSRMGKGACQGGFCSFRTMLFLADEQGVEADEVLRQLRIFLQERWKGQQTVLWGAQEVQAELNEAIHCGLLGLEGESA